MLFTCRRFSLMLEILLIWILFGLVSTFWGEKIARIISKKWIPEFEENIWIHFWFGLSFLSILLDFISFLSPFSPGLKLGVWLVLLVPVIASFSWLKKIFNQWLQGIKRMGIPGIILAILGFSIALLKSSGLPEIFDEGAYHLPLIRMWEQQGLVPGMANLNGHYGLNSSWHILTAFSNFDFFPGWKLAIGLNGLLAFVLSLYAAFSLAKILSNKSLVSDWIILFLPFFVFRNLLSSPSTDIPAIVCTWFIFTLWYKNIEGQESPWKIWPVLGVLPFWVVMIKASSAALLLVPLGLMALAWKEKLPARLKLVFAFGLVLLLPWILQNWLLTGYGVFPIRSTALGNPEWQVPLESIDKKFYLAQFGAFAPPEHFTWKWFLFWIRAHNKDTQVILLLVLSALVSVSLVLIRRNEERIWTKVYLFGTILACLITWFITITEPRYGFGALVFSALFPIGMVLNGISKRFQWFRFFSLVILMLQFLNLYKTWKETDWSSSQIFLPLGRPEVKFRDIKCGNFTGISPVRYSSKVPDGKPVFCWDCPFPCIPKEGITDSASIFRIKVFGRNSFSFKKSERLP